MDGSKFVIAGGGLVAGYAAKQLVELGVKPGELTILSADTSLPYERPSLSKGFLAGRENEAAITINPADYYTGHGIDVRLDCWVTDIDLEKKHLSLLSGVAFEFEQLIAATGSRARILDIPGSRLPNVMYLRSMSDSTAIRRSATAAKRAVVIGGGFIGMEVASVLAGQGIEVAMVLHQNRVWEQFFSPEMSRFFEGYYAARGVRFFRNATVSEFRGEAAVSSVVLADGQSIPADLAVAGVGAEPVTEWLAGSGIEVSGGVMVNEYLQTSAAGVFAAGDIANYPDLIFRKRRRVEHWDNAVEQGRHCARQLMGQRAPFRHVPYFFSDVFDLSYEFWGDTSGADQIVHRGDHSTRSFSVWWLRQSVVVAAFVMNRPDEERETAPKWIEAGQSVQASKLADTNALLAG
jgi:NADPH-dependent 2,4-dienoyl-CoA reductase/sulfur reductase-like enzyme